MKLRADSSVNYISELTISSTASLMADIANTASRGITVVKGVREDICGTSYRNNTDNKQYSVWLDS